MKSSLWATPISAALQNSGTGTEDCDGSVRTIRLGSNGPLPPLLSTAPSGELPSVPGYEILEIIGGGGMGIVYKARHRELNRTVALKMLGRDWEADRDSRERFRVEAEAVARLQHPNIIQLFEIGTYDRGGGVSQPYMSLEFVDGGNLSRYTGNPQAATFAAEMVAKVARAAGAVHQLGVIHRDLKPANVLLTAAGEPKIADFGLAKQLEPTTSDIGRYHTQAGTIIGTPEYMSPEQVDGKPPTPAVDVYALGVLLYELLTGRVPFKGTTLTETLLMARLGEPVPPRRLQPTLSRDLDTICLKCLKKSPDMRYATAEALAEDLERWAEGKAICARPASHAERLVRWTRRNPTVTGLIALSVLLFVSGLSAVVWKWREAEANADAANQVAAVERWERYRADMSAAAGALEQGNTMAARSALAEAPPEHRGWEWRALEAQLDWSSGSIAVPQLEAARFSARTRHAVTCGEDKVVRVWDLTTRTGTVWTGTITGHEYWLMSADPLVVVTVGSDHVIRIHPLPTGEPVTLAGHTGLITSVRFAAGGRMVSASHDGSVRLWDTSNGRELAAYHSDASDPKRRLCIFDVSSDGRRVIVASRDRATVALWDIERGTFRPLRDGAGTSGGQFSPDGRWYVAGAEYPRNELILFDCERAESVAVLVGHQNSVTNLAFSPDSRWLLSGAMDRTARLWEVPSPELREPGVLRCKPFATLGNHSDWVTTVAFSADGTRLATGSADRTVRLWLANGQPLATLTGHDGDVHELAFAADGQTLYSASGIDHTIRTWDVHTAERRGQLRGHGSFVYDVAFHPDGRQVLSASWDCTLAAWDTAAGAMTRQFRHPNRVEEWPKPGRKNHVNALAVHPNGRWVATSARLDGVRLWDLGGGDQPLHRWEVATDDWRVCRLAFSPDGRWLACGDKTGQVHVFDVESRGEVAVVGGHIESVSGVAFSPDGRWLATGGGREVRVWKTVNWKLATTLIAHQDRLHAITFSPDGRTLASSSADRTVRLWDTSTWREDAVLRHGVRIHALAFNPDGTRLAAGCDGGVIRIWDVARQQEVAQLRGHQDYVHAVAFSPDGKRLVSGSGDTTIRVWDTAPVGASGR